VVILIRQFAARYLFRAACTVGQLFRAYRSSKLSSSFRGFLTLEDRPMRKIMLISLMVLLFGAAVYAYDVAITGEGNAYGASASEASEQAYQNARGALGLNCQNGEVRDVHTDDSECDGTAPSVHCHVVLGATCHLSGGTTSMFVGAAQLPRVFEVKANALYSMRSRESR